MSEEGAQAASPIRFLRPHRQGDGSYFAGDFEVLTAKGVKPVEIRISWSAMQMFAEEAKKLTAHPFDVLMREHVIAYWGEEKIRDFLQSARPVPNQIRLGTTPGGEGEFQLSPLDAQLLLRKWNLADE